MTFKQKHKVFIDNVEATFTKRGKHLSLKIETKMATM